MKESEQSEKEGLEGEVDVGQEEDYDQGRGTHSCLWVGLVEWGGFLLAFKYLKLKAGHSTPPISQEGNEFSETAEESYSVCV